MTPGNGKWGQDSEDPGSLGDRAAAGESWAEAGGKPDQGRTLPERSRIGRDGGAAGVREAYGITLPGARDRRNQGRGKSAGAKLGRRAWKQVAGQRPWTGG